MKKNNSQLKKKDQLKGVSNKDKSSLKKSKTEKKNAEQVKAAIANQIDLETVATEKTPKNVQKKKNKSKNKSLEKQNVEKNHNALNESPTEKVNNEKKVKKLKKTTKDSENLTNGKTADTKELDAKAQAKIEKKKAKKLKQKLKRAQKKAQNPKQPSEQRKEVKSPGKEKNKQQVDIQEIENSTKKAKKNNKKSKNKQEPQDEQQTELNTQETEVEGKLSSTKKSKKNNKKSNKDKQEPHERDPVQDAATLFVGNLPINTKRAQLTSHLKDYAPVNKIRFRTAGGKVMYKHKFRKEAGTLNAYVVLKDAETAERALALNGSEFKGNHLRVTRVDIKRDETNTKCMVFVGNLKYSANEEKLREIFSSCGEIDYLRCIRDGEKGCKGVAYVCFKAPEAVGLALELNETLLDDRPIHVERYSEKKLGAKKARDESNAVEEKTKVGAKKRLDDKQRKQGNKKQKQLQKGNDNAEQKKKKSEFRGVKVDGFKKKQKKKKITSQMQKLAQRIAPKEK